MGPHHRRGRAATTLLVGALVALAAAAPAVGAQTSTGTPEIEMVETGFGSSVPAVNPATNRIYVANGAVGTLSVIDGATHKVTNVPTSKAPSIALVNPRTNTVFVVTKPGLDVIDGGTNQKRRTVPNLSGPFAAIDTVANRVYVIVWKRGYKLAEHDVARGTTTLVPLGRAPSAIAVNERSGKVYVTNAGSDTVTVYNGQTNEHLELKVRDRPIAVAVNPVTSKVYVANLGRGDHKQPVGRTVTVIDDRTGAQGTVWVDPSPGALAVDGSRNRIYVLSQDTLALSVIDGNRNRVVGSVTTVGMGGMGVDERTNRIYVGASPLFTIVDGESLTKTRLDAGGRMISGAVVNPVNGKVYVNNPGSGNVAVIG